MRLQLREDARSLPLSIAQDAGNRQLGVVVQDGAGDAAEERNRRVVAIAERLGRLRRIGLHEATITVGKVEGSQRYERDATLVTTNLPFDEWTEVFGSERLTGALLDRLTHHVHILEMNGDSYRLNQSRRRQTPTAN